MLNESLLSKISAYCRPSLIFVYEFIACLVDSTPISAGCDSLVKYLLDCVLIRVASVTKALVSHTLPGSIGFRKFFLFRRLRACSSLTRFSRIIGRRLSPRTIFLLRKSGSDKWRAIIGLRCPANRLGATWLWDTMQLFSRTVCNSVLCVCDCLSRRRFTSALKFGEQQNQVLE